MTKITNLVICFIWILIVNWNLVIENWGFNKDRIHVIIEAY